MRYNSFETSGANLKKLSIISANKTYIESTTITISKNLNLLFLSVLFICIFYASNLCMIYIFPHHSQQQGKIYLFCRSFRCSWCIFSTSIKQVIFFAEFVQFVEQRNSFGIWDEVSTLFHGCTELNITCHCGRFE